MPSYATREVEAVEPDVGRGLAFGALSLGLLSLVAWIFYGLSALTGLGAIALGVVANRRGAGRGMAVTGIVLGAIGIALAALYWFVWSDDIAARIACRSTPDAPGC